MTLLPEMPGRRQIRIEERGVAEEEPTLGINTAGQDFNYRDFRGICIAGLFSSAYTRPFYPIVRAAWELRGSYKGKKIEVENARLVIGLYMPDT